MKVSYSFLLLMLSACMVFIEGSDQRRSKRMKSYDGYKVLRVSFETDQQRLTLRDYFEDMLLDVWRGPSIVMQSYDVMVSPSNYDKVVKKITEIVGATCEVQIPNVQELIDNERKGGGSTRRRRQAGRIRFDKYNTLETIHHWMRHFATRNPDIVSVVQVGSSYEGRKILAFKIGVANPAYNNKLAIWQDGLIHAREWISGASLIWMANEMVRLYRQGDSEMVQLLDVLDWYILPVWNVDGYKYSWKRGQRMWRKTRSRGGGYGCRGVDLNRNFKTPCRGQGTASDYPCDEVYHGSSSFSEIESLTVSKFMESLHPYLAATVSVHSYAQYWLYPYGFTSSHSADERTLYSLSRGIVQSIASRSGTRYNHGTISRLAYPVSGGSVDWSYNYLCIKYSFGVEMRDTGNHGFMLPSNLIIPTAAEYFEGIKYLGTQIMSEASVQRSAHCTARYRHERRQLHCYT